MSDNNHHEEAHTGPIKNPKQLLVAVILSFVVPIFAIIGLVLYVTADNKPAAGSANPEKAIAERIQKIGMVEIRDSNRPLRGGEEVYKGQCAACHATGAAGAPKLGDAAEWGPRIKTGFDTLVQSALKGKNAMAPQGGGEFNDTEIARAVAYMANAGGAKFAEPAAAGAPSADGQYCCACSGGRSCIGSFGQWRSFVQAGLSGVPWCRHSWRAQVWRQDCLGPALGRRH